MRSIVLELYWWVQKNESVVRRLHACIRKNEAFHVLLLINVRQKDEYLLRYVLNNI